MLYSQVGFSQINTFQAFCALLHSGDKQWDSLRRIPYSTPGRWVQRLDLSGLQFNGYVEALHLDSLLTCLFALVPFLVDFSFSPAFVLSRRAMDSLIEGTLNLRILKGLAYIPSSADDPLVKLVSRCQRLEELEVVCQGLDPEFLPENERFHIESMNPFDLPYLHTLTLLSDHESPFLLSLLLSPLPSLRKLTVTPSSQILSSRIAQLISTHGKDLTSLLLFTPRSWPTRLHPSPCAVLESCPKLRHLSLETPVPNLTLGVVHPLQILSIPRPSPEAWSMLNKLLEHLPSLRAVRARDVRWLRKGMTSKALEAGVQGELKFWRQRLLRRGIRVLDTDWKDIDQ